jgi:hypothetical protein
MFKTRKSIFAAVFIAVAFCGTAFLLSLRSTVQDNLPAEDLAEITRIVRKELARRCTLMRADQGGIPGHLPRFRQTSRSSLRR